MNEKKLEMKRAADAAASGDAEPSPSGGAGLSSSEVLSEVDLLRWIAQQAGSPEQEAGDYSGRIANAYEQKSGD